MSGMATWFRRSWAAEPVVGFSILLGVVGVTLPVVVPPLWGTYPDTQAKAAEQARRVEVAEAAMAAATEKPAGAPAPSQ
ncbi:hypothetical protein BU14_0022s0029 [Porphyra umbilicalis]|uniref:Uncharacterized protein n=1 Tax=Porphyra umbilicalis TaxID=2786 RepID=A0A1X6PKT0_PORUM|nr:hypothetical protein BU14_0022s0029 [Porphyra umbilicalis]|eukprot:OSX81308.1 hypothetical protein BU14_0022s0029 [Porphyra umbilicalis]